MARDARAVAMADLAATVDRTQSLHLKKRTLAVAAKKQICVRYDQTKLW